MDEDLVFLLDSPILIWEVLNIRDGVHEINKNREISEEFLIYMKNWDYTLQNFLSTLECPLSTFDYILSKISPKITKEETNFDPVVECLDFGASDPRFESHLNRVSTNEFYFIQNLCTLDFLYHSLTVKENIVRKPSEHIMSEHKCNISH